MSAPARRHSIGRKLTGALLVAALVPLSIVGLITYNEERQILTSDARERLDAIATLQQARVESYLFFSEVNLELVTSRNQLGQRLETMLVAPNEDDRNQMVTILTSARDSARGVVRDIHLADLDGTILASTDPARIDDAIGADPYFADAKKGVTLSSTATRSDDLIVGIHAGPIPNGANALGVVVIEADLDPLLETLGDQTGLGDSEESYLVRARNSEVQLLTPLREPAEFAAGAPSDSPMEAALNGTEADLIEAVDYRGRDVFAATRTIEQTGWGLVVKVDQSEALAPIGRFRNLLLVSIVAAGLAAVALAHFLSSRLIQPLRRLTSVAGEMSGNGHDTRAMVDSKGEIGALARALNTMADRHDAALREVEGKNDQLQQFLYVSSHDLKTPLRAISSYGQLLAADQRDVLDESGKAYLDRINENSTRMYSLIDDLLAYVKAGQIEESFEPVNLDAVLARVRMAQELDLRSAGATLSFGHLGTAFGSPVLLEEVFANLVSNSLKYRRQDVPTRIGVTASGNGDHVTVSVEDNGIGIPAEHRERVFEPFHRLHRKDEIAGTGVGLAICERVVSGHGGTIRAASSNLGGTAIVITLPRFSS